MVGAFWEIHYAFISMVLGLVLSQGNIIPKLTNYELYLVYKCKSVKARLGSVGGFCYWLSGKWSWPRNTLADDAL